MAEPAEADASPPWREAASSLAALLAGPSPDPSEVGRLCESVLEAEGGSDDDGASTSPAPPSVRSLATTALLRSLLRRGEYREVVSRCEEAKDGGEGNALEWAYGLYRLRRYGACRDLCEGRLGPDAGGGGCRGLRHVRAQALYRLGETEAADAAYRELMLSGDDGGADGENPPQFDADEAEDVLSNALANLASNHTAGSTLGSEGGGGLSWVESDGMVRRLMDGPGSDGGAEGEGDMLQNYDLAYNLATYLLASAEARDSSHR